MITIMARSCRRLSPILVILFGFGPATWATLPAPLSTIPPASAVAAHPIALAAGRSPVFGAPALVTDINQITGSGIGSPYGMAAIGDRAYFVTTDDERGTRLWQSDGSVAGTRAIVELADLPRLVPSVFGQITIVPLSSGMMIFIPTRNDLRLYRSDGTTAGTTLIASLAHNPNDFVDPHAVVIDDTVYFTTRPSSNECLLWRSDGTAEGTSRIRGYYGRSDILLLTGLDGFLYFSSGEHEKSNRSELWRSDGTLKGTVMVLDRHVISITPFGERLIVATSNFPISEQNELWSISVDQLPQKIGDISVRNLAIFGDHLLLASQPRASDTDLYVSDGTAKGTRLIWPQFNKQSDGYLDQMVTVGDRVFLTLIRDERADLWLSDGTRKGTVYVRSFGPLDFTQQPYSLISFKDRLFFAATDAGTPMQLWMSDGSGAGTAPLSGNGLVLDQTFTPLALGDRLVFAGSDGTQPSLWISDGTVEGTIAVSPSDRRTTGSDPQAFRMLGDRALFFADDGHSGLEPWASDGSPAGTLQLRDINPGPKGSMLDLLTMQLFYRMPDVLDTDLYFLASTGHSVDMWRSDGTPQGTEELGDALAFYAGVAAAADGTRVMNAVSMGGVAYFYRDTDDLNLWRSDGTKAGTYKVSDVAITYMPTDFGIAPPPAVLHGQLYFYATDTHYDAELWVSDGTAKGTVRVADINPGKGSSYPFGITVAGDRLFFVASDGVHGKELWVSDGTATGTRLLRDINSSEETLGHSSATIPASGVCLLDMGPLPVIDGKLYFLADDGATGCELWVSDGTERGTRPLRDIYPGTESSVVVCQQAIAEKQAIRLAPSTAGLLRPVMGGFVFAANDGAHGCELWFSDGTPAGTRMVRDINPGSAAGVAGEIAMSQGGVLLAADDGILGAELWFSNGRPDGTFMIADIRPGLKGSKPTNLTAGRGRIFFSADDGAHGAELWMATYRP